MARGPETNQARSVTVGGVTFDVKFTLLVIFATLLPTIDFYHNLTGIIMSWPLLEKAAQFVKPHYAYDQLFFFFFAPMLIILLVFRDKPSQYGFSWGKAREGLVWTLVVCPLMAIILWFLVRNSDMNMYYRQAFYTSRESVGVTMINPQAANHSTGLLSHANMLWSSFLLIFPWEFLWRGFFLFGLARVIGPGPAIFIQAMPFALLHIGKPEVETLTTIFGGAGFGFIAWRTQSFFYAMVIHYFILVATNVIASGVLG